MEILQTMKTIYVMCGLPRSGKSTYIEKFLNKYFILSADRLRKLVYGQRYFSFGEPLVWHIRQIILHELLDQSVSIVIDEINVTRERRQPLIELGKKYGYRVICIWIQTPVDICTNREPELKHVIEEKASKFEDPTLEEGFDEIGRFAP